VGSLGMPKVVQPDHKFGFAARSHDESLNKAEESIPFVPARRKTPFCLVSAG
jgi:hypothetical protein